MQQLGYTILRQLIAHFGRGKPFRLEESIARITRIRVEYIKIKVQNKCSANFKTTMEPPSCPLDTGKFSSPVAPLA